MILIVNWIYVGIVPLEITYEYHFAASFSVSFGPCKNAYYTFSDLTLHFIIYMESHYSCLAINTVASLISVFILNQFNVHKTIICLHAHVNGV